MGDEPGADVPEVLLEPDLTVVADADIDGLHAILHSVGDYSFVGTILSELEVAPTEGTLHGYQVQFQLVCDMVLEFSIQGIPCLEAHGV
ncbi:hypothetical protein MT325_m493L [Paramecium bursaria chlorella virus MT325]|uniref:Uncharacterized protein m493L n=1 Tax=Paramecium bursaria Chlorella virus MT325 TaxID=346932 RepID=A7IUM3_PBCVM|nr:hypothetical protein MT325_m493L [Paramecium bursaria chlorella virus MT325]